MARGDSKPKCGAETRAGTPCLQPAGFGTDHPGYGSCKNHAGNAPGPKKHAARVMLEQRARELQDQYRDIVPEDEMLAAVRQSAIQDELCRLRAQDFVGTEQELPWRRLVNETHRDKVMTVSAAIKLNLSHRMVQVAERQGDQLTAAFLRAIDAYAAAVGEQGEDRARAIAGGEFVNGLRLLPRADDVDGDAVA